MKVLHILRSDDPSLGGPSEALIQMTSVLVRKGINVDVVTTSNYSEWHDKGKSDQPIIKESVRYFYFPIKRVAGWAFSFQLCRWLQCNISTYDLVHIHGIFTFPPLAGCYWARRCRIPYIIRPAGTLNVWGLQQKAWKKQLYRNIFLNHFLRDAISIHATSEEEMHSLSIIGYGERVKVIPLGVDVPELRHLHIKKQKDILCLLILSRIHPVKNLPLLLRSMSQIKKQGIELRLTIAGDGERIYLEKLNRLIDELDLHNQVNFVGFVQGNKKLALMEEADLFILPSFQESFGVAVVEAMATGLPVIISDQVALANEVLKADAGRVVPVNSVDKLTSVLLELRDPRTRERMSNNARNLVEEKFSLEVLGKNLDDYYKKILSISH